jgi:proteasome activator subunit 4
MKGALYVLGSKSFGNMAILDWNVGPTYIMKLLQCQHEQKPSVQQLVQAVTQDYFIRLAEPSVSCHKPCLHTFLSLNSCQTIKLSVTSKTCSIAAAAVEAISGQTQEPSVVDSLSQHNNRRIESRNVACEKLVPELLAVAQNPSSHWRYVLTATVCALCLCLSKFRANGR